MRTASKSVRGGERIPPRARPQRLAAIIGLLWALCLAPTIVAAQTETAEAVDPVVGDVVRMLEVGIEPDLILRWLESSGKRPGPLSADDVIALSQAKAPKELIQALLDLAGPSAGITPATPDAPSAAVQQPAAPASGLPSPQQTGVAPVAGECCLIDVSVEYRATEDLVGEEYAGPEHDLFLYVDGHFLARLESQGNIAGQGPVPFKARLAPGDHALRLTRELHTHAGERAGDVKWDHLTTVSPSTIPFRVEPGADWNLDVRWVQGEFSLKRPLHWRWSRDGVEVAGQKHVGAFREDWPYLCEDVEASREDGGISGWRAKDRLKGCVKWKSLWSSDVRITRAQVLAELRRDDFEPTVTTAGRID